MVKKHISIGSIVKYTRSVVHLVGVRLLYWHMNI